MEPNIFTDIINLLLWWLYSLQVIADVLSDAARAIGFLP